jgi:class 3 adenylate cyclase/tetratricopeptide (TPR) repeat protein
MRCPSCHTIWPDELAGMLNFCGACGAPLKTVPLAASIEPTQELGGEVRFVTVLFVDLVGFTTFAEDHTPDDVARIIGNLLQRLGKAAEEHNGAVYQFLGDAVVATFGLPYPDPNASRNAVRAGLAMHEAVAQYNLECGYNFEVRIGIHSGEVMFRALGSIWTMMGDTVNTASRIQSVATPGKLWISRPVYEEVRRFFTFVVRPAIELKGKKQAIQAYEVVAERLTPVVNLPRFVGREAEWAALHKYLEDTVQQSNFQILLVRGAAGVGKSRLIWELREWIQRNPAIYRLDIAQFDHSEKLASHGLNTLIRNRFDLALDLDEDTILQRLKERMPAENPSIEAENQDLVVEFFAFILGISRSDFHINSMDGQGKWDGAFVELRNWMQINASSHPWIWILEDAQKGDADTASFLEWALHIPWSQPVLVIVTVREEDFIPGCYWYEPINRWIKDGLVREIRLREIYPPLLAHALTSMTEGTMPEELVLRIAEHTEGNPLFATEIVLLLKELATQQDLEQWQEIKLPGSIRDVMEARLEKLGHDGKDVAKRGALMGRRFTREAVERIWNRSTLDLTHGLTVLRETETIYEEASKLFSGEIEEVFRHGRLHEVALARIPREDRLRWLAGLESWARSKLEQMGEHWQGASMLLIPVIIRSLEEHEAYTEASYWYEVQGLVYSAQHRTRETVQSLHAALKNSRGVRKLVLYRQAAEAETFNGEGEKALETLAEASLAADPLIQQDIPADISPWLGWLNRDPLGRWEDLSLEEAAVALDLTRGDALTQLGRVDEARQVYESIVPRLESLQSMTGQRLWLRWGHSWCYLLGELLEENATAQAVCQIVHQKVDLDNPALESGRLVFLNGEALVEYNLGRYDRAQEINDERLELSQRLHNPREESRAWNLKGIIALNTGDLANAFDYLQKAVNISRSIGYRRGEVVGLHNLAATALEQGKSEIAQEYEEQYLNTSRIAGNPLAEAYARYAFGEIALYQGNYGQAEAWYQEAMQIAEENHWPAQISMVRIGLGELSLARWFDQRQPALLEHAIIEMRRAIQADAGDEGGEIHAKIVLAYFLSGNERSAQEALLDARENTPDVSEADRCWLDFAEAVVYHKTIKAPLLWFRNHGFRRATTFIERFQTVLGCQ